MGQNFLDIETGHGGDDMQGNDPQMRWGFIRKVYSILCLQLLLTFGVALAMFLIPPVREFMRAEPGAFYVFIGVIALTFILCILMTFFRNRHPWNYLFTLLFTVSMAVLIGVCCAQLREGEAVLLAAGLTLLIAVALTVFTFVAAKRGQGFSFLGPFLVCAAIVVIAFVLVRIMIFPMGGVVGQAIGCICALVFAAFIIQDTGNMIKRYNYDEYIQAAAGLYLDMIDTIRLARPKPNPRTLHGDDYGARGGT